jgi:hypothetical protein
VSRAADSTQTAHWLARTRERASVVRDSIRTDSIRARGLDSDIGQIYEDCLSLLDAYESYLISRGVTLDVAGREAADLTLSVFAGLRGGNEAERRALRRREIGNYVSWADLDSLFLAPGEERRSDAGQELVDQHSSGEREHATLREVWKETKVNTEELVRKLTARYGWEPEEVGFGASGRTSLSTDPRRLSRNPFAMVRFAVTRTQSDTPEDFLEKARMCVAAADLVPEGAAYDVFRADFLREAATLGVRATVLELEPFSYGAGPAASASEAARLSKLYLAASRDRSSGDANMLLSHSLASAGQFGEAIRAANEDRDPWSRDPSFCYRYAKLMSLTYQLDLAGDWLAQAYDTGFHDIDAVRADADLASFRAGHPELYAHLTNVRWTFTIIRDQPRDDIVVTNKSPFALTNVIIDIYIRQGSRAWEPVIRLDSLEPLGSYKAHDVMSVPGGRHDEATGVLFCDQDP